MDDLFRSPYVDVDEWRDEPARHRYVHGGFEGTVTRFSFYLPPESQYEGRFLHTIEGGLGGNEHAVTGPLSSMGHGMEFAFSRGAYMVESNQGHLGADLSGASGDNTIITYRASAATAEFSKLVAAEMYGGPPHHGYCYGGSGGGIRSVLCLENTTDVWSGAVPFIMPHARQGTFFSIQANAVRILKDKIFDVIDAMEPGGDGRPFDGLSGDQADALAALYRAGFPRRGEFALAQHPSEQELVWTWVVTMMEDYDPEYFADFWNEPGYVGHDHPEMLADDLVDVSSNIARVVTAGEVLQAAMGSADPLAAGGRAFMMAMGRPPEAPIGIVVDGVEAAKLLGARLEITSGAPAGRRLYCLSVDGDVLYGSAATEAGNLLFADVQPGDAIKIDNREYLSYCYYYRCRIDLTYPEFATFGVDGQPLYPQRVAWDPLWAGEYEYRFDGKMIIVQNTLDRGTWPSGAVSYATRARQNFEDGEDRIRLWWTDHASHMPAATAPGRLVDFGGAIEQAVRDLIDWVEFGKEPPADTRYEWTDDHALRLGATAADRGGIQPVIDVTANGQPRAEVDVGGEVAFTAIAEVPPATGGIVQADWDFDGSGAFAEHVPGLDGGDTHIELVTTHVFDRPGTYFPAVRVVSTRDGDPDSAFGRVANLGRTRVVVR